MSDTSKVVRLGLIGLGEIAQVNHISSLSNLSTHFRITYICDVSPSALLHCAARVAGLEPPQTTTHAETLCASPSVDAVLLCNSTAFHPAHAILALQHDKYVLVEKPLALCYRDIDAIIEAERKSKAKVFVGYQRRYAEAFLDAVTEVGGMAQIQYARVRDIIGQNAFMVGQSGTYPKVFTDIGEQDTEVLRQKDDEMVAEALTHDYGIEDTSENRQLLRLLGGLGSHDLSAMREIIGMPMKVVGADVHLPYWTVLFAFEGFSVMYESGINDIPVFDAHIEVYSPDKIVRVQYDTPYVKGLPVTMTVRERIEGAKGAGYQERVVRKTYEDPYVLEFLEFYECVVRGKTPKTSAQDARHELDLFKMIMQAMAK